MTSLFDSFDLGGLRLPNRVVMAPMTRARATVDGLPTSDTATYYAQRATAGLLISEGIQPSLQGKSNYGTPGLHNEEQVAAWKPVTQAVHVNGGRIFAQIMHSGRVSHSEVSGVQPVAPSAVRLEAELYTGPSGMLPAPTPRALATSEIQGEIDAYVNAAKRAIAAGFDGVELHGANGYLIQQFLSSNVNTRTDIYGGSITGRIRFVTEVAEAVSAAIGPERVGIRFSPNGTIWDVTEDDTAQLYTELFAQLSSIGLVYVHLLTSADDDLTMALHKEWPNAFILSPSSGIVGQQAGKADGERWLANGVDLVSFGRAYLANPDLVERFRLDVPLAEADPNSYYAGGTVGYTDYPSVQH